MNTQDWSGCYDGSWQSAPLVAEAYAHPAKVSFNLAERIYRHMLTEEWLKPGMQILDPFGGVGCFAFHAALYGMHWTGVELEQRFVDLGIGYTCNDSHLCPVCAKAKGKIESEQRHIAKLETILATGIMPEHYNLNEPDEDDENAAKLEEERPANADELDNIRIELDLARRDLEAALAAPSFPCGTYQTGNLELWRNRYAPHFPGYGTARLLQGDSRRLVEVVTGAGGVVSSPPYADAVNTGGGSDEDKARRLERIAAAGLDPNHKPHMGGPNSQTGHPQRYGTTRGQLGAMPAGVVSSPPFENSNDHERPLDSTRAQHGRHSISLPYGTTPGNIGNTTADTFWSAAAAIVAQCYAILRPGGYAAWVTGDFVRAKRRVPFGRQWLDLCVSCGFEPVLWAVAWKSEHNGAQMDIFGEAQELRTEKVSFFRRLANAKHPESAILNEDVLFLRKPA